MNRFIKNISNTGNSTLIRRASAISQASQIAYQNIVNSLKAQKSQLELKKADLIDLAPDSTDSLRPGTKDFDAQKWAEEIQSVSEELWQIEQSLEIAEENYNYLFVEVPEN